jgi:hypothetical protein
MRAAKNSPAMARLWMAATPPLLLGLFALGCLERQGRPVNPCTQSAVAQAIEVDNVDRVDVLFLVDNSRSMREEQEVLALNFPEMVRILASGDFDLDGNLDGPDDFDGVNDLNVGVITSDMGVFGLTVDTCSDAEDGEDGVLRSVPGDPTNSDCLPNYPPFLNFTPPEDPMMLPAAAEDFGNQFGCVAQVGTNGCGFEQQLEAILKSISPRSSTVWTASDFDPPEFLSGSRFGRADDESSNGRIIDGRTFIRDNSVLAIIPVTDEEDCSAADEDLFNEASTVFQGRLNLRCFRNPDALYPVDRYVDGYLQLRERPDQLIFAPIVGIPPDLAPDSSTEFQPNYSAILNDPRMQETPIIPPMGTIEDAQELEPSCNTPGLGVAFPPRRIVAVAQGLASAGAGVTVQSICQGDFRPALQAVIAKIRDALTQACLPRALPRRQNGEVSCNVVVTPPSGMGCDVLAGWDGVEPEMGPEGPLCVLTQRVPTQDDITAMVSDPVTGTVRRGRPPSSGDGWYYDDYTDDTQDQCRATPQRIAFIGAQLPTGSVVNLECLQAVSGGTEDEIAVGTLCEPSFPDTICGTVADCSGIVPGSTGQCLSSGDPTGVRQNRCSQNPCLGGATPSGEGGLDNTGILACDPVARSCGVECTNDANCREAGLVGFVCDTRNRGDVDPSNFPDDTTPYNFCVNPTCGS